MLPVHHIVHSMHVHVYMYMYFGTNCTCMCVCSVTCVVLVLVYFCLLLFTSVFSVCRLRKRWPIHLLLTSIIHLFTFQHLGFPNM